MGKVVKVKVSELTPQHFEEYPVWAWAEGEGDEGGGGGGERAAGAWAEDAFDEDLVEPVLNTDPIPEDSGAEFIKAEFYTPSGLRFDGYVVGVSDVFAVELYVQGAYHGFNIALPDWAEQTLARLRGVLGDADAQIFPLRYETNLRFADEGWIAGVFDPFNNEK